MTVLFETVKLLFLLVTIAFLLLIFKGNTIFPTQSIDYLHTMIMPGYLVLCGVLMGYLIYLFRTGGELTDEKHRAISVQSFIIGVMLGLIFALLHTFVL